eukprot:TRINITY_DN1853_c1_g2_i1.p1 TRINITY_DN1853_c1_g2~~TRINITY_DN1853_c1_g2_i1.p1  ORF type:complete len:989 (+),score=146.90 TRINITY_DN1853_c1_g2_i1:314-2968(+)
MGLLNADLNKVVRFVSELIADKNRQLLFLAGKAVELNGQGNPSLTQPLLQQTQSVVADVVKIASFVFYNVEGFRKIVKKYDKRCEANCGAFFLPMLRSQACLRDDALDQIIIAISDVFSMLRTVSAAAPHGSTWNPPESFERSTTKYVVKSSDVARVKLLIAEHLPILIVGRPETTSAKAPKDMLNVIDNSGISSVYFDNPELDCYHERILRQEGARLFRLRWYGDVRTPHGDEQVFVERKTHHESWAVESSVKERFGMKARDVPEYLAGKFKPAVSDNLVSLADEIQAEVLSRGLRPVVRTVYQRTAFQASTSNDVRISIDTGLSFVDELRGMDIDNEWCRRISSEGVDNKEVMHFPWAVLEVKLTAGQPPWVESLLETGLLHELQKFSKFSHGMASIYERSGILRESPYWFDSIKCDCASSESSKDAAENAVVSQASPVITPEVSLTSAGEALLPSQRSRSLGEKQFSKLNDMEEGKAARSHSRCFNLWRTDIQSQSSKSEIPQRPGKVEPKTYFANERTFIQWVSPVIGLVTVALGVQGAAGFFGSTRVALLGAILNAVGVIWMLFALYMYLKRLRKLQRHDSTGWDARCGPIMLVLLLAVVCVAGSIGLLASNRVPLDPAVASLRAPDDAPLTYAADRFQRGCMETPMELDAVRPRSWEIQEELYAGDFATVAQRQAKVRQWEATMAAMVIVDKFTVKERTEHKFCVEGIPCDRLVTRHRYMAPNETYAIFKFGMSNGSHDSNEAAPGRSSWTKLEMNAYCERQSLGYSLYVADPPPVASWSDASVFNGLTSTPIVEPEKAAAAKLVPVSVFHQTTYEYKINSFYGAPAKVVFQWSYFTETDRALGRDAARMEISLKLKDHATLSTIRRAEGLLEALVRS